jgi:hypothetical protein
MRISRFFQKPERNCAFMNSISGQVPQLLSGRYRVVTEMGRSLFLKAGTSLTRVEHVKVTIP